MAFLIYLDEYGDTGTNWLDPSQPAFALFAALIDESTWGEAERVLIALALEIAEHLGLEEPARLHMVDIYQRKGPYRSVSVDQAIDWCNRVFEIAWKNSVLFHARIIASKSDWAKEPIRAKKPPYVTQFPHLLLDLDSFLDGREAFGLIFTDLHEPTRHFQNLTIYRALRFTGVLKRILEKPQQIDSREHTMVALADFAGYAVMGHLRDKSRGKMRPGLEQWAKLVQRMSIQPPLQLPGHENEELFKRAIAVANFFLEEELAGQLNLSSTIKALQAGLDRLPESK